MKARDRAGYVGQKAAYYNLLAAVYDLSKAEGEEEERLFFEAWTHGRMAMFWDTVLRAPESHKLPDARR